MTQTTTTTPVRPDELNSLTDWDSPFRVHPDGHVTTHLTGYYAPDVHDDASVVTVDSGTGWQLVNGYSGQHGYSGPGMHASETLSGGLARDILATPGVYAVTACQPLDLDPETGEPYEPESWCVVALSDSGDGTGPLAALTGGRFTTRTA